MTDSSGAVEDEVLRLRSIGRSYSRISRELGFDRPLDAQRAFQRAFRGLPAEQLDQVRREESSRLDRLVARITADTDRPPEDRTRQLAAIERLRASLATAKA